MKVFRKEGCAVKKQCPLVLFDILIGVMLCMTGCATEGRYMTTFTPEQEPPRHLDMGYNGPKANIAIGGFEVKALGAAPYVGDGLREMLETALFESKRFNVLDRADPKQRLAEQSLSYSKMAEPTSKKLGGQWGVAELLIYSTVTEFMAQQSGAAVAAELPKKKDEGAHHHKKREYLGVDAEAEAEATKAHMAIDIKVVDVASGNLVAARRISGSALSGIVTAEGTISGGDYELPLSLGAFKNTPMELAIRDCVYRSVVYTCNAVPRRYFVH
jgi:curli biogenesis system outer membrane secretion channel CsgG